MITRIAKLFSRKTKPTKSLSRKHRPLGMEQLELRALLATLTVNSVLDTVDANPGDGVAADAAGNATLRAAVMEAEELSGPDTIQFDSSLTGQTITLTEGQLPLIRDDNVTINGLGADNLTISGNNESRIFTAFPESQQPDISLEINDLTLTDGFGSGQLGGGGLIATADVDLTVRNSVLTNSSAGATTFRFTNGGAIMMNRGSLAVSDSIFSNNISRVTGGAIRAWTDTVPVPMDIVRTTFVNNSTGYEGFSGMGGAIHTDATGLQIEDSQFIGNMTTDAGQGGAINTLKGATIINSTFDGNSSGVGGGLRSLDVSSITGSTFSNNVASSNGGAVAAIRELTIDNSTISGNTAARGGGIYGLSSIVEVLNSTVVENEAVMTGATDSGVGGGILSDISSVVEIHNSIVALNVAAVAGDDLSGGIQSLGYNLIGTGNVTPAPGDIIGSPASPIDPMIGPLQDNGGPTPTHELLAGSPAVDAGDPASTLTVDQRGFGRPHDGDDNGTATIDIGAFEFGGAVVVDDPETSIANVLALIEGFRDTEVLGNGEANPILNHLEQALRHLVKDKTDKTIDKLEQARDEIQDLIDDMDLTSAEGQPLIDTINDVIDQLLAVDP